VTCGPSHATRVQEQNHQPVSCVSAQGSARGLEDGSFTRSAAPAPSMVVVSTPPATGSLSVVQIVTDPDAVSCTRSPSGTYISADFRSTPGTGLHPLGSGQAANSSIHSASAKPQKDAPSFTSRTSWASDVTLVPGSLQVTALPKPILNQSSFVTEVPLSSEKGSAAVSGQRTLHVVHSPTSPAAAPAKPAGPAGPVVPSTTLLAAPVFQEVPWGRAAQPPGVAPGQKEVPATVPRQTEVQPPVPRQREAAATLPRQKEVLPTVPRQIEAAGTVPRQIEAAGSVPGQSRSPRLNNATKVHNPKTGDPRRSGERSREPSRQPIYTWPTDLRHLKDCKREMAQAHGDWRCAPRAYTQPLWCVS